MSEKANFKVDPRLAKLLGESYRSTEYALKELVDNAWDADATVISITLPDPVTLNPITVQDNGSGMTEQELRKEYLTFAERRPHHTFETARQGQERHWQICRPDGGKCHGNRDGRT